MAIQIGEYLVGAYLKLILECDVVDYNVKPPGGGLEGMNEMDVIGLDFKKKKVYLCEVATHIGGLNYGKTYQDTFEKIFKKHKVQIDYADKYLTDFPNREFMFWSPRVPKGKLIELFNKIETMKFVFNEEYSEAIDELRESVLCKTR
jgi:hypothetical protein